MRVPVLAVLAFPAALLAQTPAPPDLSRLPAPVAASAPEAAAEATAEAPKRRCVAGCEGETSARVSWTEDNFNRFEEHRNARGELVKLFVHPKNGAPRYEILVGNQRSRTSGQKRDVINPEGNTAPRDGQAVWRIKEF